MSAGLERDLLEQEWNGPLEIMPSRYVERHIRFHGDEARVTLEHGEDEQTTAVFYGTPEEAQRWLGDIADAINAETTEEAQREVCDEWLWESSVETGRLAALGWGDLESGRIQAALRAVARPHRLPSVGEIAATLPKRRIIIGEHADGTPVELEIGGRNAE